MKRELLRIYNLQREIGLKIILEKDMFNEGKEYRCETCGVSKDEDCFFSNYDGKSDTSICIDCMYMYKETINVDPYYTRTLIDDYKAIGTSVTTVVVTEDKKKVKFERLYLDKKDENVKEKE